MHQDDINKDLGHYLDHKSKQTPFWKGVFNRNRHVEEAVHKDVQEAQANENITAEDKKELENMEQKIEAVNKVEEEVEETIETEKVGLLQRFFKKLKGAEKEDDDSEIEQEGEEHAESQNNTSDDEEMKDFLKTMHEWIKRLPSEDLQEFKNSEDFKLYTKILKKHNLIKGE